MRAFWLCAFLTLQVPLPTTSAATSSTIPYLCRASIPNPMQQTINLERSGRGRNLIRFTDIPAPPGRPFGIPS